MLLVEHEGAQAWGSLRSWWWFKLHLGSTHFVCNTYIYIYLVLATKKGCATPPPSLTHKVQIITLINRLPRKSRLRTKLNLSIERQDLLAGFPLMIISEIPRPDSMYLESLLFSQVYDYDKANLDCDFMAVLRERQHYRF